MMESYGHQLSEASELVEKGRTSSAPADAQGHARGLRDRLRALLGAGGPANGMLENAVVFLGGGAVVASAVVHLHLWLNGYGDIATIGPLFLAQAIGGFLVAAIVVSVRRVWAALLGGGFLLATAAGFLLSVHAGLFGFEDTWSAPFAASAFWLEVSGAFVLATGAVLCRLATTTRAVRSSERQTPVRARAVADGTTLRSDSYEGVVSRRPDRVGSTRSPRPGG